MRSWRASCISGSPADMVFTSIHWARPAMSEASAMTSGEEEHTSRRNCLRAFLSPASAVSETVLSSVRRPFASTESSSTPGTSPLSSVSVVSGGNKVGSDEILRRLRQLLDRDDESLQAFQLRLLSLSLRLTAGSPEYRPLGEDAGELPRPDVDLAHPLAVADAQVVVDVPVPALERHAIPALSSSVLHTRLFPDFVTPWEQGKWMANPCGPLGSRTPATIGFPSRGRASYRLADQFCWLHQPEVHRGPELAIQAVGLLLGRDLLLPTLFRLRALLEVGVGQLGVLRALRVSGAFLTPRELPPLRGGRGCRKRPCRRPA